MASPLDTSHFLLKAFSHHIPFIYLFAGRAVLFTPRWLGEDLKQMNKDCPRPFWSFVVFAHSLITGMFFCCLSAALFTSFAIDRAESAIFYAALTGAFLVLYTLDITNFDLKFPRISETVTIIAVYVFFAHVGSGAMIKVFISYGAIFLFINLVLDGFTRYKLTTDRITFTGVYAIVFLLGSAIGYGTILYGQVSSKLGGARPQIVSVGLSEEARKALPAPFSALAGQALEGKLIHQTSTHAYVVSSGRTLRLRAADIVALVTTPEPEKDFWKEYMQRIATTQTSLNPSLKGTSADKPASAP